MKTTVLPIIDAMLFEIDRFEDDRGFFEVLYAATDVLFQCLQINCSKSRRNVLRGIHVASFSKIVHCVKGSIFDVVVDMRPSSHTYLKWYGVELNEENRKSFFIPANCGHGFLSLEDNSMIVYAQSGLYNPATERTVRFDDPIAAVLWPGNKDQFILSEKDRNAEFLST